MSDEWQSAEHDWAVSAAGRSAQAEFERRRERNRARIRRQAICAPLRGRTVRPGRRSRADVVPGARSHTLVVAALALVQLTGFLQNSTVRSWGLWAVETKNIRGKVVIRGDTLRIGGHRRDKIIDQVKQEATIIQVVLGESLVARGLRVTPVICLHRGELPFFNKSVRGVRLASGRQLVKMLRSGDRVLSTSHVEVLAREADRLLMPAVR